MFRVLPLVSTVLLGLQLVCSGTLPLHAQGQAVTDPALVIRAAVESYGDTLPLAVKQTVDGLVSAALSGDIEALGEPIEYNELPPDFGSDISPGDDPIKVWRSQDAVFEGRAVLAAIVELLTLAPVKLGSGEEARFVWPSFADQDIAGLSPSDQVALIRLVGAPSAARMVQSGNYTGWQLMITADGVWHSFTPPEPQDSQ